MPIFDTVISRRVKLPFRLSLPKGYAEKAAQGETFPLLLFLHGMGERGTNLQRLSATGLPKLLDEGLDIPFIVLMPLCPEDSFWNDEVEALHALVEHVTESYAVDAARRVITGLSMGGYGTYEMLIRYPQLFSAAVPICGGVGSLYTRFHLENLKEIPLWIFHGRRDEQVPVEESLKIYQRLKDAGAQGVKLTVYEDLHHDSWSVTYANPQVYDFLLEPRLQADSQI